MTIASIKLDDQVALICPGSRCDDKDQVIQTMKYLDEKHGLKASYQKETYQTCSKKMRAEIFCDYLFDPTIKLMWALRGGEGSADLIPIIHQKQHEIKRLTPKLLMGFSDITALLLYFSQQYNWPVIHGFNARQLALKTIAPTSVKLTFDLLFNLQSDISLKLQPLNVMAEKKQLIEGLITGGNLSLINISIRDIWEIQTKNKILFLEDVNEKPHAVLRTLKYFNRIGLLKNIQAIILGQFMNSKSHDNTINSIMQQSLKEWAKLINKPIWHTSQISHGENNVPIPFYRQGHVETITSNQATLFID